MECPSWAGSFTGPNSSLRNIVNRYHAPRIMPLAAERRSAACEPRYCYSYS